jgi:hypothetical protein
MVVIGPTGGGKSTVLNYIFGCGMELVGQDIHKIPGHPDPIVRVSPKSQIKEVMKIGHDTSTSMTILSSSIYSEAMKIYIYDCAGIEDTRGLEVNITNNVNMRMILKNARSLKILLLVTYQSLSDVRGAPLMNLLKMSYQMFGGQNELLKNKASFFLNVTKVPDYSTLEGVKSIFFENKNIKALTDRVIILDVFEKGITGGWDRARFRSEIGKLKPIVDMAGFKIALSDSDLKRLTNLASAFEKKLVYWMEKVPENAQEPISEEIWGCWQETAR